MGGISVRSQSLQMGSLRLRVQHIKRRLQSDAERLTSLRLTTVRLIETNRGRRRREHWTLTLHGVGTLLILYVCSSWWTVCLDESLHVSLSVGDSLSIHIYMLFCLCLLFPPVSVCGCCSEKSLYMHVYWCLWRAAEVAKWLCWKI